MPPPRKTQTIPDSGVKLIRAVNRTLNRARLVDKRATKHSRWIRLRFDETHNLKSEAVQFEHNINELQRIERDLRQCLTIIDQRIIEKNLEWMNLCSASTVLQTLNKTLKTNEELPVLNLAPNIISQKSAQLNEMVEYDSD